MFEVIRRYLAGWHKVYEQHKELSCKMQWPPGLKEYFMTPIPSLDALVFQVDLIALDFETSGLNAATDQILSIGWVPMSMDQIDVGASQEFFIRNPEYVNADSASINQILPDALENGIELHDAMARLFTQLAGKIPLVHGTSIERAFLEAYLETYFGISNFPCLWIDTIKIEKNLTYTGKTNTNCSFQLNDIRQRYGLPNYNAHSAAIDALSTAELFTAQMKAIFRDHPPRLSKLVMI
jgi:DNA polymerase-3 subunit epsilon